MCQVGIILLCVVCEAPLLGVSRLLCLKQTKILCGQLNCSVKLADVSTRCSSHPQRKSEARCENAGVLIGVALPGIIEQGLASAMLHIQVE